MNILWKIKKTPLFKYAKLCYHIPKQVVLKTTSKEEKNYFLRRLLWRTRLLVIVAQILQRK